MISSILKIDFNDYTESIPAYIGIIGMPFMYSISEGISLGIVSYVVINLVCERQEEDQSTAFYIWHTVYIEAASCIVDPFLRIIDNRMVAAHAYQKETPPGGSFLIVCLRLLYRLNDFKQTA